VGFVVLAVVMRPIGGWLSDRFGPVRVLLGAYGMVTAFAAVAAFGAAADPGRHDCLPGHGRVMDPASESPQPSPNSEGRSVNDSIT
jgi:nitrate/nitrite transporter NarK